MTDTIPLRPCPWCGTEERQGLVALCERFDPVHIAYIHCEKCGARGPSEYHDNEAAALRDACNAWNKRA